MIETKHVTVYLIQCVIHVYDTRFLLKLLFACILYVFIVACNVCTFVLFSLACCYGKSYQDSLSYFF